MNKLKPPTRRRQVDRSAASTAAMLDAAIELIIEQGANISMMAIGQRSGFSHGLVLARFGSKAGLNEMIAQEALKRFTEIVDAATLDAKGLAKLHGLIDTSFQSRLPVSKAFYVLLGAALGPDPQLRTAFAHADKAYRSYIQGLFQDAQAMGEIDRSIDTEAMATLVVGMLRGVGMQYFIDPEALKLGAVGTQAHALIDHLEKPADTQRRSVRGVNRVSKLRLTNSDSKAS
jgi:AcrR family transcriptional regulator